MRIRVTRETVDVPLIRHQDDHGFRSTPLFQFKDSVYSARIRGIASDAPDGIGWIQDNPSPAQNFQAIQNVLFKFQ